MFHCRLIDAGGMLRIGLQGLFRDTLIVAVIFSPSVYLIGRFSGDFVVPVTHLATSLLVAGVLRVAWIPLLRLQAETINSVAGYYAGAACFIPGAFAVAAAERLFGWAVPAAVLIIPLSVGIVVAIVGWDRIACRMRPQVPKLQAAWQWINRPIRSTTT